MKTFKGILVLGAVLLMAMPAFAQEQQMDQQAMMEMMEKLGSPGEMHQKLEPFVGTFDAVVTMWMAPGTDPMTSKGTSKNEWILDGRYVAQYYEGEFMGKPFNGMGLTGYDNFKKEYVSSWIDSMSTAMMIANGKVEGNTWTYKGMMDDPMSGQATEVTDKIIIEDNDHHVMEMWIPGPDGEPFKTMEIHYTRTK